MPPLVRLVESKGKWAIHCKWSTEPLMYLIFNFPTNSRASEHFDLSQSIPLPRGAQKCYLCPAHICKKFHFICLSLRRSELSFSLLFMFQLTVSFITIADVTSTIVNFYTALIRLQFHSLHLTCFSDSGCELPVDLLHWRVVLSLSFSLSNVVRKVSSHILSHE